MILTDREIKIAIDKELILINPEPKIEAYTSTALDLTLHRNARIFKEEAQQGVVIDPGSKKYNYESIKNILTEAIDMKPIYSLDERILLLAWTNEIIELPLQSRLAARVEGKSSLARIGISVHITAPTIHAGFRGPLQLEILNHGPSPIILRPDMRICQLIFESTLGTPEKGYSGQHQDQIPQ